jgi:hypothetical protein
MHYIGLIDATNILYTFGLIFMVLAGFVVVISASVAIYTTLTHGVRRKWIKSLINFVISVIAGLLVNVFASAIDGLLRGYGNSDLISIPIILRQILANIETVDRALISYGVFVFAISIGLIFVGIREYTSFATGGQIHARTVIGAAIAIAALFYLSGALVSTYYIILSPRLYTFNLKDNTHVEGKIFRSSSNGFIVVVNGNIVYYPKDEVTKVESNRQFGSQ